MAIYTIWNVKNVYVGIVGYPPKEKKNQRNMNKIKSFVFHRSSGGGSTESQYFSKNTNNQINIYFSKSRSNTMTTILKYKVKSTWF